MNHEFIIKYIEKNIDSVGSDVRMLVETNPYQVGSIENLRYFNRSCEDKWAFYILSKGCLWFSGERIKFHHQRTRDWVEEVLKRHYRRYKIMLPKKRIYSFLSKIEERWNWPSHHRTTKPTYDYKIQKRFEDRGPCEQFTRVNFHQTDRYCPFCGGTNIYHFRDATKQELQHGPYDYDFDISDDQTDYSYDYKIWCRSKICNQAKEFLSGKHHLAKEAKKLKIVLMRNKKIISDIPDEFRPAYVLSEMLDFEARYEIKKQKTLNK
jgi:hypothetical protein